MAGLPFNHLSGLDAWRRCDHAGTTLHAPSWTVRLATEQEDTEVPFDAGLLQAWLDRRFGAVLRPLSPDLCPPAELLRGGADGALQAWTGAAWETRTEPDGQRILAMDARDGVLWVLSAQGDDRALRRLWLADLSPMDTVALPGRIDDIALCAEGALAIEPASRRLWRLDAAGVWHTVAVTLPEGMSPVSVAGDDAGGRCLCAGSAGAALVSVRRGRALVAPLETLRMVLGFATMADGDALVGEIVPLSGGRSRMDFARLRIDSTGDWRRVETRDAVGYTGQGLFVGEDGEPWAATGRGPRRIVRRPDRFSATLLDPDRVGLRGRVETIALDGGQFGLRWHRVFVDAVLPNGAEIRISARTSDTLLSDGLARTPRPPAGWAQADGQGLPLGSTAPDDDEGWMPVGALDRRPPRVDQPLSDSGAAPSPDPFALSRGPDPRDTLRFETMEGLLKNPPGRYLWLRLELVGTRRVSPELVGLRATRPRPSMLALLPAWWRADPDNAARMDEVLSLFEGAVVELESRVDRLPWLFDPLTTPAHALPWLASFIGLSFDERLAEGTRRQLLAEAATLHRQRGTVAGLRRLCQILADCDVEIVETFRTRRASGARIGQLPQAEHETPAAVLGAGLVLPTGAQTEGPTAFYAATAHRFQVLIFRAHCETLHVLVDAAIEANKPAHTEHTLCWVGDSGRLGVSSRVGLGTVIGRSDAETKPAPLLLGDKTQTPLGGVVGGGPTVLGPLPARPVNPLEPK